MPAFSLNTLSETTPLIKTLKQALAKAIRQAITYTVIQKVKRISGESTKDVDFTLENGQKITVVIRQSGDVVRVKINDKDFPMSGDLDPDYKPTFNDAIREIATKVKTGQTAFEKRRAREKVIIPRTPSQRVKSVLQQIKDKQEQESLYDLQLQQAHARKADLEAQLKQLKGEAA